MATYAIGDLQGCLGPLERLLLAIDFDRSRDQLWFVGDLVNRGPESLACLRLVQSLGESAVCVLGNHDFHLLCVAAGVERARKRDTLDSVLGAPDRESILAWLRHRPLMHVQGAHAMVHAGLLPEWTIEAALERAAEVEAALRGRHWEAFLANLYGNAPTRWEDSLAGYDRLRVVVNAMTRLRVCHPDGSMNLEFKGEPDESSGNGVPWFDIPGRRSATHTLVCGHWSALGLRLGASVLSLDSGCVWGRALTALRLEDRQVFQVPCWAEPA